MATLTMTPPRTTPKMNGANASNHGREEHEMILLLAVPTDGPAGAKRCAGSNLLH